MLAAAIENLAKAIAPVLSHMAEDIWQFLPYDTGAESVFQSGWVQTPDTWVRPDLVEKWQRLRTIRDEANTVLEQSRSDKAIGSSLEAKLLLSTDNAGLMTTLKEMNPADSVTSNSNKVDELRYLFLVSQVELSDSLKQASAVKYQAEVAGLTIGVAKAEGAKCDRCWNYSTHVGESSEHPTICDRCVAALSTSRF